MNKEKFYWKVVRNINGKFYSVSISKGKYCLEYKIGEEIVAPFQGIFVFDTRDQARSFKRNQEDWTLGIKYKIIKVKITGDNILPKFYDLNGLENNSIRVELSTKLFPIGTRCFKSIIPLELSH